MQIMLFDLSALNSDLLGLCFIPHTWEACCDFKCKLKRKQMQRLKTGYCR